MARTAKKCGVEPSLPGTGYTANESTRVHRVPGGREFPEYIGMGAALHCNGGSREETSIMYRTNAQKRSGKSALLAVIAGLSMLVSACATGPSAVSNDLVEESAYDLSQYQRVMIDPVEVNMHDEGEYVPLGSHVALSEREREKVEADVAEVFNETFREELTKGGAVQIVDRPGPGVMRITPKLLDVNLSAPAPMSRGGLAVMVRSVGEVTLQVTFTDAQTGDAKVELFDKMRGRDIGLLRRADATFNNAELTRIFRDWAQVIRQDLFRAS